MGWEAALLEIEHQADHWDTSEHGDIGRVIAGAMRSATRIARGGGLRCEHRATDMIQAVLFRLAKAKLARSAHSEPRDQTSSAG